MLLHSVSESQKRVKAVNFDDCKKPPKLIDYHSKVPLGYHENCVNFIYRATPC